MAAFGVSGSARSGLRRLFMTHPPLEANRGPGPPSPVAPRRSGERTDARARTPQGCPGSRTISRSGGTACQETFFCAEACQGHLALLRVWWVIEVGGLGVLPDDQPCPHDCGPDCRGCLTAQRPVFRFFMAPEFREKKRPWACTPRRENSARYLIRASFSRNEWPIFRNLP